MWCILPTKIKKCHFTKKKTHFNALWKLVLKYARPIIFNLMLASCLIQTMDFCTLELQISNKSAFFQSVFQFHFYCVENSLCIVQTCLVLSTNISQLLIMLKMSRNIFILLGHMLKKFDFFQHVFLHIWLNLFSICVPIICNSFLHNISTAFLISA